MSLPVPQRVRDNDTRSHSALVFALAWVSSVPWALLHGPVGLQWVVFQALGAAIIPAVAGWWSLWRRKGDLRGALWVTEGVVLLLLMAEGWHLARG
jgi:hypothetical protein